MGTCDKCKFWKREKETGLYGNCSNNKFQYGNYGKKEQKTISYYILTTKDIWQILKQERNLVVFTLRRTKDE